MLRLAPRGRARIIRGRRGQRFERLRQNAAARAFLDGAGLAAIGAILGAAILLTTALDNPPCWSPSQ
jgi:hypothetical protein